jgi:hypothetical protein
MIFAEGMHVIYKEHSGIISFFCEQSLSICISEGVIRSQDVNIVVYKYDFENIRLFKESTK